MPGSYIGYGEIEALGAERLYPVARELSEAEAARHDALAELAEADALDTEGAAELDRLVAMLDGAYTVAQTAHAGLVVLCDP